MRDVNGPVHGGDLFIFYGLLILRPEPGRINTAVASRPAAPVDLEQAGEYLGPCRFLGALYDLGAYPGVVRGPTLCHGVLYRLDEPAVAPALDAFEGIIPEDPVASEYQRARVPVLDDDGRQTGRRAWIYLYNQDPTPHRRLASGRWTPSA